ncbi:MAG: hypothetical protein LBM77_09980 [Spirochaetaceae bacterium]|jgi:hypothetical protein|nr:hypothetical protein [Spirochaetaceae bacterium]
MELKTNSFCYAEYVKILNSIKNSGKAYSFAQLSNKPKEKFVIVRHDVEFSVERAYKMALVEHEHDFHSTYFFQLTNNAYNVLSEKNLRLINAIRNMAGNTGWHEVGLHFHLHGLEDIELIKKRIKMEIDTMSAMMGFQITSFSIHRPPKEILRSNIALPGIINAYDKSFFEFTDDVDKYPPKIKYMTDSRHHWNYNLYPDEDTIMKYDKVQILIHPYSWTETGYGSEENFDTLIQEEFKEYIGTLDTECNHFRKELYENINI